MHTGFLGWQNLASEFALLRKRSNMVAHIMLCISQKHTVLLLNTQPRSNIREEYYLRISSSFFGSGLLRLCLCLCPCLCFCRSLRLGSRLANVSFKVSSPTVSSRKRQRAFSVSVISFATQASKRASIVDRETGVQTHFRTQGQMQSDAGSSAIIYLPSYTACHIFSRTWICARILRF